MARRRRARRDVAEFSLSFLDVISCGFGAIILLLLITKTIDPFILEHTDVDLDGLLADLQEQLHDIRGDSEVLNRQITVTREELAREMARLAALQNDLSEVKSEYLATRSRSLEDDQYVGQLAAARQSLTEEMQRLLGLDYKRQDETIGGIPVDSEYIIFVIDTSGSMFNGAWPRVLAKFEEVLNIYPEVKGIQVMNDMGDYMFTSYAGRWIPDSPARRRSILNRMQSWNPFSNSSPVEGIQKAISTFWAPDRKISIYVFGDEFTGRSITEVIDTIDAINIADANGGRRVRIHAIGFPTMFAQPPRYQTTGIRFATLMRELTYRNGGTFVGLEDFR